MIVQIDRRFRGPPDSGNGGYVAGALAGALGGSDVEVMLRAPPPLGVDLTIEVDGDEARLTDGETIVATAARAEIAIDVPAPPSVAEARAAEAQYIGHRHHLFPGCFVCGPERSPGDGLRIFPGNTAEDHVAAQWMPDQGLGDETGVVRSEFLWSALDCPGYWAVREAAGMALLGRIGAILHRRPSVSERLVVTGWAIQHDGRKHHVGTAVHDEAGELVAAARATWISLKN